MATTTHVLPTIASAHSPSSAIEALPRNELDKEEESLVQVVKNVDTTEDVVTSTNSAAVTDNIIIAVAAAASVPRSDGKKKKKIQPQPQSTVVKRKSRPDIKPGTLKTKKKRVIIGTSSKPTCTFEGCIKKSRIGGVCATHGAKAKRCGFIGGCTNQVVQGGMCIAHGAKVKVCSVESCANGAVKGGVCITHGAIKKRCNYPDGCNNKAVEGGRCITHGAKVKRCNHDGCNNHAKRGGVCITHGAKESINNDKTGVACVAHGGATKKKKRLCTFVGGCTNIVVKGGVCITLGAKRKHCSYYEGCTKYPQAGKGGLCIRHSKSAFVDANNTNNNLAQQQTIGV